MPHSHLRVLLAAALTANLPANAAEWVAEPTVSLRQSYDDNIRLTNASHDSVWGTTLDPRLKLSRRSELWDINGSARLRASRYNGEDGLDTNDSFFDIAAKRQLERGSVEASASLINDTTLQNETLDLDTGLTINQIDRTQRSLNLVGQYLFTETTWLEASASYSKIDYAQGEINGLLDYDNLTPSLRIIHQLDPKLQLFSTLSHSTVDYDSFSALKSTTDSLQIGAAYDITETWKVSGSIGGRRTNTSQTVPSAVPRPGFELLFPFVFDITSLPRDSESTGLVFDASLAREFETGSLTLNANQSITPSSTGTDTESTRISLAGNRKFSAKLSAQLAVSYNQSTTVGDTTTLADNKRLRIGPSFTWRFDEDLSLNTGYSYTRIERGITNNQSADNNAIFASLGYTWPRMSVSR